MHDAFQVRLKFATMLIHEDFPPRSGRGLMKHPFSALTYGQSMSVRYADEIEE